MDDSQEVTNQPKTVEIALEDGTMVEVCPLVITEFKVVEGGNEITLTIPEELEGVSVAVMLVAKSFEAN